MTPINLALVLLGIGLCISFFVLFRLCESLSAFTQPKARSIRLGSSQLLAQLPFREAFDFKTAAMNIERNLQSSLNEAVGCGPGDPLIISLKVLDLQQSKDLILAKFPDAVTHLMKQGKVVLMKTKEGNEILTEAVMKDGGRLVSHARQVDPSLVKHLASAGTLIVGAAHIISGYDNAQKLKLIDKKLDRVLSNQSNEMKGELQAIYESARECLASPNEIDESHLRHLRLRIKHLRCNWFLQIETALDQIEDPEKRSRIAKFFSKNKSTSNAIQSGMTAQEENLYLVRFAVQLEEMIAVAAGEHEAFQKFAIPEVRVQVQRLADQIKSRREWIQKLDGSDAGTFDRAVQGFLDFDESLTGDSETQKKFKPEKKTA